MRLDDTIAAPITGLGKAAVAVVRVSGPSAWEVAAVLFDPFPSTPKSHRAYYGRVAEVDDGLMLLFAEGRGYTGQPTAEFSIHGSPASVRLVMEAAIRAGARPAEPGEFTWRAFANGRLDLSQAEAVRDTVESETRSQLALSQLMRAGALRSRIGDLRDRVLGMLATVEAHVDFGEELGEMDRPALAASVRETSVEIDGLLATADSGRIMRHGMRIAILGRPNAGKSSLLNALLQSDRAIVSEIPGTTRDYVEEKVDLGGVPCVLIDTAGLRPTGDTVEAIGVNRAREIADGADWIWYVFDGAVGFVAEDGTEVALLDRMKTLVIANKADLVSSSEGLPVSAKTREGLDHLIRLAGEKLPDRESHVMIQERHTQPLKRSREALRLVLSTIEEDLPDDLLSSALRETIQALGEITGETASADMIDRIFAGFCVGK